MSALLALGGLALLAFTQRRSQQPPTDPALPAPAAKPPKPKIPSAPAPPPPDLATVIRTPDGRAPQPGTTITASQRAAALALADYIARGGDPGAKKKPAAFVRDAQLSMGMGPKEADGIYGPITQKRGAALGATMPPPPGATKVAPAASVPPSPAPAAKPPKAKAKPAPPPPPPKPPKAAKPKPPPPPPPAPAAKPAKAKPAAKPATPEPPYVIVDRSAKQAALELAAYLARGGAAGSKKKPAPFVLAAQRDMGMSAPERDGIVGPKTKAAVTRASKDQRSAAQAAQDIAKYARDGNPLGTRKKPEKIVELAQRDMLMAVKEVDGIYGPITQKRGTALGANMPTRK